MRRKCGKIMKNWIKPKALNLMRFIVFLWWQSSPLVLLIVSALILNYIDGFLCIAKYSSEFSIFIFNFPFFPVVLCPISFPLRVIISFHRFHGLLFVTLQALCELRIIIIRLIIIIINTNTISSIMSIHQDSQILSQPSPSF